MGPDPICVCLFMGGQYGKLNATNNPPLTKLYILMALRTTKNVVYDCVSNVAPIHCDGASLEISNHP